MNTLSKILASASILALSSNVYSAQVKQTPKGRNFIKQGTAGVEEQKKDLEKKTAQSISTGTATSDKYKLSFGFENTYVAADFSVKTSTRNLWLDFGIASGNDPANETRITRTGIKYDGRGSITENARVNLLSAAITKHYPKDNCIDLYAGPALYLISKERSKLEVAAIYDKAGNRMSYNEDSRTDNTSCLDLRLRLGADFYYKGLNIGVAANISARGEHSIKANVGARWGRGGKVYTKK